MSSITLHNLEKELERSIRKQAREQGTSLNKTIHRLLRQALGLEAAPRANAREELKGLFGSWTQEEADVFEETLSDMRRIDPKDWT